MNIVVLLPVIACLFGGTAAFKWQTVATRRGIPEPVAPPPRGDVGYGPRTSRDPFSLVLLGDSFAAGYGAHRSRETPAALLAAGISRRLRRRVTAHTLAVPGAETPDLPYQVDRALCLAPDLAVIYIGGNDVTMLAGQRKRVRQLGIEVRRLRAAGCTVVVGTCPDLGVLPPFRPPLSWVARFLSRRLAAAQTIEVARAGGFTVSLASLLNPYFAADPERMFGHDRFHPSAEGYARAVAVTLPTVLAVLPAGPGSRPRRGSGRWKRRRTRPPAGPATRCTPISSADVVPPTPSRFCSAATMRPADGKARTDSA
ncbi:SGNH/GDSL hydrolase family protein [Actinoplanes sp. NPDC049265]|uniref:SGNH/GDSL hydrolase family protein n=1 Tax=Actinoplanes sp. NPDC049265 TaxID=3363902 RepID=UPI003721EE8C